MRKDDDILGISQQSPNAVLPVKNNYFLRSYLKNQVHSTNSKEREEICHPILRESKWCVRSQTWRCIDLSCFRDKPQSKTITTFMLWMDFFEISMEFTNMRQYIRYYFPVFCQATEWKLCNPDFHRIFSNPVLYDTIAHHDLPEGNPELARKSETHYRGVHWVKSIFLAQR